MASEISVDWDKAFVRHAPQAAPASDTLRATLDEAAQCGWRFFLRQADMLDSVRTQPRALGHLPFVFHHAVSGRRIFTHVHPLELLHRTADRRLNYFYEIIAENAPSKLYLDLEFSKKANPDVDGDALTTTVVDLVLAHLNARFGLTMDRTVVVQLESSSDAKFSTHVVLDTPFLLRNNIEVGQVVRQVTNNGQLEALRVLKKDSSGHTCFVDLGVYTKNRHFRILGSRKFGGAASLEWRGTGGGRRRLEEQFLRSLVTGGSAPVVELPPPPFAPAAPPPTEGRKRRLEADSAPDTDGSGLPPEVDAFFERLLAGPGVARVLRYRRRRAVVFASGMGGVCGNKGAAHQRHRVLWLLAERLGTAHQRCGDDADCPRYRSARLPLPPPLLATLRQPADPFEAAIARRTAPPSRSTKVTALRRKDPPVAPSPPPPPTPLL